MSMGSCMVNSVAPCRCLAKSDRCVCMSLGTFMEAVSIVFWIKFVCASMSERALSMARFIFMMICLQAMNVLDFFE